MRNSLWLAGPLLLGLLSPVAWAIGTGKCGPACMYPPPLNCPGECDVCEKRVNLNVFGTQHALDLIAELKNHDNACIRAKAAKKLGCRLHADICHDPGVLEALLDTILLDPCWEVRKEAIWALYWQGARNKDAYMVLYVAQRIDPHYMVRDAALHIEVDLLLCNRYCMQPYYNAWDKLIAQLRRVKFRAGECDSRKLFEVGLASWKNEMEALAANGITGQDLPRVPTPALPPPVFSGVPSHWQPPHPPWSRAQHPVPHRCDDGHPHPEPAPSVIPAPALPIQSAPLVAPGSAAALESPARPGVAKGGPTEPASSPVSTGAEPLHLPTANPDLPR